MTGVSDDAMVELVVKTIADRLGYDTTEIKNTIKRMLNEDYTEQVVCSEIDYRYDEYRAFQGLVGEDALIQQTLSLN